MLIYPCHSMAGISRTAGTYLQQAACKQVMEALSRVMRWLVTVSQTVVPGIVLLVFRGSRQDDACCMPVGQVLQHPVSTGRQAGNG